MNTLRPGAKSGYTLVLMACMYTALSAGAQVRPSPEPVRMLAWPMDDAASVFGTARAEHLLYVAGASGMLYLISRRDADLADYARLATEGSPRTAWRVVEELGNAKAVRPMAAMFFLGSLLSEDQRMQDAAFTSLQAIVFANVITNSLKAVAGRSRPFQAQGPHHFRPFSGSTSFPSGHSTTVFALSTPWLLYYPGPASVGLMLVSAGTAASRVATDHHWLSDVVAGSAIGFATAYWLSRRHQADREWLRISPVLMDDGAGISVTIRP
jgi:membrane-associated phospholipid phosphatase